MTREKNKEGKAKERQIRLARALRDNLRRRKAARKRSAPTPSDKAAR